MKKTKAAIMMSLGSGCDLALEYRWKNIERVFGWAHRGRAEHDLLLRGLQIACKQNDIELAIKEIQAASTDDASVAAKQAVKAGKAIDFMTEDVGGAHLQRAFVLPTICGIA